MIESGRNFDDISAFVTSETEGLIRSGRLLPYSNAKDHLKDLIIKEVIEKVNGMYVSFSAVKAFCCCQDSLLAVHCARLRLTAKVSMGQHAIRTPL